MSTRQFYKNINFLSTNDATNSSLASLVMSGGVSIQKNLRISQNLSVGNIMSSGLTTGSINFTGTLYQNSIPYIGSQWTSTNGSVLYYGSGGSTLVGINTTNPTSTLTVNGDLNVNGNVTLGNIVTNNVNFGIANTYSGSFVAGNNIVTPTNITGFSFTDIMSFSAKVTVSILRTAGGNLFATYTLDGTKNDGGWVLYTSYDGDNTGVDFNITNLGVMQYTSTNITNFTSNTFRYTVTQITNTGTYNTLLNPTVGSYIVDGLSATNFISTNFSSSNLFVRNITTSSFLSTSFANLSYNCNTIGNLFTTGGNVGINTSLPIYTLDVNGTINVNKSLNSYNKLLVLYDGASSDTISGSTNFYGLGMNSSTLRYQTPSGSQHIWYSSSTGTMSLTGSGTLTVIGDIGAFGTISDARLKTNVNKINSGLSIVNDLNPVTFSWKDDIFNQDYAGKSDSGFLAQEVEIVIPHAVGEYTNINDDIKYKNMRHERIIPYLVSAIQELTKKVNTLEELLKVI
jgi:hypothetical protein